MVQSGIRVIAICVFRHDGRILAAPGLDHVTGERFFRPLGGAVEFGEAAVDALRREIREELHEEIERPVLLGVLENLFQFDGRQCHEIAFVFDAHFVNTSLYAQPSVPFAESGWEWDGHAEWLNPDEPLREPLYPSGLGQLLKAGPITPRSLSKA